MTRRYCSLDSFTPLVIKPAKVEPGENENDQKNKISPSPGYPHGRNSLGHCIPECDARIGGFQSDAIGNQVTVFRRLVRYAQKHGSEYQQQQGRELDVGGMVGRLDAVVGENAQREKQESQPQQRVIQGSNDKQGSCPRVHMLTPSVWNVLGASLRASVFDKLPCALG